MAKTHTKIIAALALAVAAVGIVYAWYSLPDRLRWERGYPQIATGDSVIVYSMQGVD